MVLFCFIYKMIRLFRAQITMPDKHPPQKEDAFKDRIILSIFLLIGDLKMGDQVVDFMLFFSIL